MLGEFNQVFAEKGVPGLGCVLYSFRCRVAAGGYECRLRKSPSFPLRPEKLRAAGEYSRLCALVIFGAKLVVGKASSDHKDRVNI